MNDCVYFAVRDDDSAKKIGAILESLGYPTQRDLAELDVDVFAEAAAAAARRYRMTQREQQMLEALLRGLDRQQIAETLKVTRATIKWHLHNIYAKLGVQDGEAALRKALFLDDPRWLCAPLRHRDALERIVEVAEQVLRAAKSDRRPRLLEGALVRLEEELAAVRRDAGLEPPADDDPASLPISSTRDDSPPHTPPT